MKEKASQANQKSEYKESQQNEICSERSGNKSRRIIMAVDVENLSTWKETKRENEQRKQN